MKKASLPKRATYALSCLTLLIILSVFVVFNAAAQNAIATENALPGNPASEWDVDGAGDLSIQGFATDISVNKGETVHFKIKTDASAYTIKIYRLGYYNGDGARKIGSAKITATLPQSQPNPLTDASTGLVDCGNWSESARWNVPANAVSGVYIAKLTRTDTKGSSHIVFIVRDDTAHSNLFFQTSDATWQAYNAYGGNSLYVGNTSFPNGHAAKVSYNRPFITRNGGGGGGASEDWLFNAEYPMIRWLEHNGYDVTYTTSIDAARHGNLILNHKVYMSVGHDEYWSGEQRANVEAARNAGVHLAFFSGNEIYWKTRFESSIDGTNTSYRTLVCYKEGTLGENVCGGKCDPLSNVWTGLWRDGCNFPQADGCRPENALSGQISWDGTESAIQVPGKYKNLRFWRNTGIATLDSSQTKTLTAGSLGYEWDWSQYKTSYPQGRVLMSSTIINGHTHNLSIYRHSSGALVFGAGTVQWSWGLDTKHDRSGSSTDKNIKQATVNLFADMGVQPTTLETGLVLATASNDNNPPASVITYPAQGATITGSPVTITGTSSDVGGGVSVAVEISVDGGATWQSATGTSNWTYTWTPSTGGSITIKSRAVDDLGNLENPGSAPASNAVTVNVSPTQSQCPCTIFQNTDAPFAAPVNDNTGAGIELGVKFKTTSNGYITGLRYYKGAGTTGTHTGHLWTSTGSLLAQATFSNETSSGWQQVTLDNPVAVSAGTIYVASYYSSSGDYAYTDQYFTQEKVAGPLTAIADSDPNGPNGVFIYTNTPTFPVNAYQASNYWADVVFKDSAGPDTKRPTVVSVSPLDNTQGNSITTKVSAIFSEAIDPSTVSSTTFKLKSAKAIAATVSYDASKHKAILTPSAPLNYSTTYTATIKGGSTGIKDLAGNPLAADYVWTFTTSAPPPPTFTDGPGGPVLLITSTSNPFSRFPAEILRAEGLNEFKVLDLADVNSKVLDKYDVVVVGNISLTATKVTLLTNWTNAGGTLIALKPDSKLASLLGLSATSSTLANKYLLVNTSSGAGAGIVNQTIQFHGTSDLYTLNGATALATLYSDATTPTVYPAVTTRDVGSNGGRAIAFTYDLARSIVYTRQGNPLWAGQKRDGQIDPIRSDDLFFPDWIDFNKVAIPQADEQQHLFANIILQSNLHKKPLPRFWFLPRGLKAA
ncbi:MAG TPA: N,N-dimethylformamidase beta subunit family domain-containing protein, partial [Parafilimonas sp.]|nr:N,N-dimethylformamidase beta subunit family domain-containing protein [Parafilimonas sp.]